MHVDEDGTVTLGVVPGGGFDQWKPQPKDVTEPFMVSNIIRVFDNYAGSHLGRFGATQLTFLDILDSMAINPVRLAHVIAWLVDCGYMEASVYEESKVLENCQPYTARKVFYSRPRTPKGLGFKRIWDSGLKNSIISRSN